MLGRFGLPATAATAAGPPATSPAPLTAARIAALESRLAGPEPQTGAVDPLEDGLRRLAAARQAVGRAEGKAALAALDHASVKGLPVGVHVRLLRADALLLARREAEAVAELEAILDGDLAPRLRLQTLTRLLHASRAVGKEHAAAMRVHRNLALLPADADAVPPLLISAARTLAAGNATPALDLLRHVSVAYPTAADSSEAEEALAELAERAKVPPLSGAERLARVKAFLEGSRYISLKREITELRKIQGFAPAADDAEMLAKAWGKALLKTASPSEALAALRSYEKQADVHPDAVYDLAAALHASGDAARRTELQESILRAAAPGEPAWRRVVRETVAAELALDAEADQDLARAASRYLEAAAALADSPRRDEWLFRGGFLAWRSGDRERALRALTEEVDAFPDSTVTPAALYWRGRIRTGAGDTGADDFRAAAARFPTTYYGRLAASRAGVSPAPAAATEKPAGDWREAVLARGDRGAAALLLRAAGWHEAAFAEAEALAATNPDDGPVQILLAAAHRALGKNQRARELVRRALPGIAAKQRSSAPPEIWDLVYPLSHVELLKKAARENGVPLSLLLGLVYQESSFEADATSRAGAMGLMQLMPGTASDLARELRVAAFSPERAYEPELNVTMGSRYLASLLKRTGGSEVRSLAGYNGGPARTEKYWERLAEKDPEVFVESIPLKETRLYVKKVLEAKAEYERVHGPF